MSETLDLSSDIQILVLDDLKEVRDALVGDLKKIAPDATYVEAEDIAGAVSVLNTKTIHFIFSDWHLPDGTGFQLLQAVKGDAKLSKIPFIMCTTVDEATNIIESINLGADEFIVKPWDQADLASKFIATWKKHNP